MMYKRKILTKILDFINSEEAIVITGMRRTGKTTILKMLFDGIKSENKLFIDLENPLNRDIFYEKNYESIKLFFETKGLDFGNKAYLFIDEIQLVKEITSFVKYMIDHYKVKFFLTGSSSFYLKNPFSESLAGRKIIFELFPLDFEEFLLFKKAKLKLSDYYDRATYELFKPYFNEYFLYGGFPEVVLKNNNREKEEKLFDIYTSYFQKEIEQLSGFRKNLEIKKLISLLAQNTGEKLDINRLSKEVSLTRITIKEYIEFLNATYFIHLIPPFTKNKSVEIRKSPKIYFCDTGLLRVISEIDSGKYFENLIFQNLRVNYKNINFYRKLNGVEIDFIVDKKIAFEVKETAHLSDVRKLSKVSDSIGIKNHKVISKNFSEENNIIFPFSKIILKEKL